jgi:RHS repeat-associated protein
MNKPRELNDYVGGQSFCCGEKELVSNNQTGDNTFETPDYEHLIFFYHPDHLGSTALVTDNDGNVVQSVAYIPYGEVFIEERNGTWNTPYLFNGKELDEETGLYYYGARYLNPTSGMWLSVDPLWKKNIDASPYSYCHGNPVGKIDFDGRTDFYVDGDLSTRQYVDDGVHEVIALSRENFDILASIDFNVNAEEYNCVVESGRIDYSKFPTINNVLSSSEYASYCDFGVCFDAAIKQNTDMQTGPYNRIDLYNPGKSNVSFNDGTDYIVSQLKVGKSVVTGVYDGGKPGNKNPNTGHFINICGMGFDKDGKNYFSYYDNATCNKNSGMNLQQNRFYKGSVKEGVHRIPVWYDNTNVGVRGASQYIITEVRRNK